MQLTIEELTSATQETQTQEKDYPKLIELKDLLISQLQQQIKNLTEQNTDLLKQIEQLTHQNPLLQIKQEPIQDDSLPLLENSNQFNTVFAPISIVAEIENEPPKIVPEGLMKIQKIISSDNRSFNDVKLVFDTSEHAGQFKQKLLDFAKNDSRCKVRVLYSYGMNDVPSTLKIDLLPTSFALKSACENDSARVGEILLNELEKCVDLTDPNISIGFYNVYGHELPANKIPAEFQSSTSLNLNLTK